MSDKTTLFEKMPVSQAIWNLALPSIAGQIILVIYNIADTFFVSLTRNDELITAVTICMPAFLFLSAISNLFGVGGASVISRLLGKKEAEKATHAAQFAVWGCLCTAALYSVGAWLFLDGFIDLLGGAAEQVHTHAVSYMVCTVVCGGVATAMNTLFSHLVRAEGRSFQASLGIMIGGVLNILLDPIFMFRILPPGNEALGAALATMFSNFAALGYFAVLLFRGRARFLLSVRPERAMFGAGIPKDVIRIGIPACLMTLFENISYAVLDHTLAAGGIAVQAGIGVAKKVNMLAHCIVRGMAQGVLPMIGYNYACENYGRMRATVLLSAAMSIGLSVLCMVSSLCFADPLIGIFLQDGSHSFGVLFLKILCIGAPFSSWAYTVISFFQATGHMKKSLMLALLRKGVLDIPLMFLLGRIDPVKGVVAAIPTADLLCCMAAVYLFVQAITPHVEQRRSFAPVLKWHPAPRSHIR